MYQGISSARAGSSSSSKKKKGNSHQQPQRKGSAPASATSTTTTTASSLDASRKPASANAAANPRTGSGGGGGGGAHAPQDEGISWTPSNTTGNNGGLPPLAGSSHNGSVHSARTHSSSSASGSGVGGVRSKMAAPSPKPSQPPPPPSTSSLTTTTGGGGDERVTRLPSINQLLAPYKPQNTASQYENALREYAVQPTTTTTVDSGGDVVGVVGNSASNVAIPSSTDGDNEGSSRPPSSSIDIDAFKYTNYTTNSSGGNIRPVSGNGWEVVEDGSGDPELNQGGKHNFGGGRVMLDQSGRSSVPSSVLDLGKYDANRHSGDGTSTATTINTVNDTRQIVPSDQLQQHSHASSPRGGGTATLYHPSMAMIAGNQAKAFGAKPPVHPSAIRLEAAVTTLKSLLNDRKRKRNRVKMGLAAIDVMITNYQSDTESQPQKQEHDTTTRKKGAKKQQQQQQQQPTHPDFVGIMVSYPELSDIFDGYRVNRSHTSSSSAQQQLPPTVLESIQQNIAKRREDLEHDQGVDMSLQQFVGMLPRDFSDLRYDITSSDDEDGGNNNNDNDGGHNNGYSGDDDGHRRTSPPRATMMTASTGTHSPSRRNNNLSGTVNHTVAFEPSVKIDTKVIGGGMGDVAPHSARFTQQQQSHHTTNNNNTHASSTVNHRRKLVHGGADPTARDGGTVYHRKFHTGLAMDKGLPQSQLEPTTLDLSAILSDPAAMAVVDAFISSAPNVQSLILGNVRGRRGSSVSDKTVRKSLKNVFFAVSKNPSVRTIQITDDDGGGSVEELEERGGSSIPPFSALLKRNEVLRAERYDYCTKKRREEAILGIESQIRQEQVEAKKQKYDLWRVKIQIQHQQMKKYNRLCAAEAREWMELHEDSTYSFDEAQHNQDVREQNEKMARDRIVTRGEHGAQTLLDEEIDTYSNIMSQETSERLTLLTQLRRLLKSMDSDRQMLYTEQYEQRKTAIKNEQSERKKIDEIMYPAIHAFWAQKREEERIRKEERQKEAARQEAIQQKALRESRERLAVENAEDDRRHALISEQARGWDTFVRLCTESETNFRHVQRYRESREKQRINFLEVDKQVPKVTIKLGSGVPLLRSYQGNQTGDLMLIAPEATTTVKLDQPMTSTSSNGAHVDILTPQEQIHKLVIQGGVLTVELARMNSASSTIDNHKHNTIMDAVRGGGGTSSSSTSTPAPMAPQRGHYLNTNNTTVIDDRDGSAANSTTPSCEGVMLYIPYTPKQRDDMLKLVVNGPPPPPPTSPSKVLESSTQQHQQPSNNTSNNSPTTTFLTHVTIENSATATKLSASSNNTSPGASQLKHSSRSRREMMEDAESDDDGQPRAVEAKQVVPHMRELFRRFNSLGAKEWFLQHENAILRVTRKKRGSSHCSRRPSMLSTKSLKSPHSTQSSALGPRRRSMTVTARSAGSFAYGGGRRSFMTPSTSSHHQNQRQRSHTNSSPRNRDILVGMTGVENQHSGSDGDDGSECQSGADDHTNNNLAQMSSISPNVKEFARYGGFAPYDPNQAVRGYVERIPGTTITPGSAATSQQLPTITDANFISSSTTSSGKSGMGKGALPAGSGIFGQATNCYPFNVPANTTNNLPQQGSGLQGAGGGISSSTTASRGGGMSSTGSSTGAQRGALGTNYLSTEAFYKTQYGSVPVEQRIAASNLASDPLHPAPRLRGTAPNSGRKGSRSHVKIVSRSPDYSKTTTRHGGDHYHHNHAGGSSSSPAPAPTLPTSVRSFGGICDDILSDERVCGILTFEHLCVEKVTKEAIERCGSAAHVKPTNDNHDDTQLKPSATLSPQRKQSSGSTMDPSGLNSDTPESDLMNTPSTNINMMHAQNSLATSASVNASGGVPPPPPAAAASGPVYKDYICWNGAPVAEVVIGYAGPVTRASTLHENILKSDQTLERALDDNEEDHMNGNEDVVVETSSFLRRNFSEKSWIQMRAQEAPLTRSASMRHVVSRQASFHSFANNNADHHTTTTFAGFNNNNNASSSASNAASPNYMMTRIEDGNGASSSPCSRREVLRLRILPGCPRSAISDLVAHLAYFNANDADIAGMGSTSGIPSPSCVLVSLALQFNKSCIDPENEDQQELLSFVPASEITSSKFGDDSTNLDTNVSVAFPARGDSSRASMESSYCSLDRMGSGTMSSPTLVTGVKFVGCLIAVSTPTFRLLPGTSSLAAAPSDTPFRTACDPQNTQAAILGNGALTSADEYLEDATLKQLVPGLLVNLPSLYRSMILTSLGSSGGRPQILGDGSGKGVSGEGSGSSGGSSAAAVMLNNIYHQLRSAVDLVSLEYGVPMSISSSSTHSPPPHANHSSNNNNTASLSGGGGESTSGFSQGGGQPPLGRSSSIRRRTSRVSISTPTGAAGTWSPAGDNNNDEDEDNGSSIITDHQLSSSIVGGKGRGGMERQRSVVIPDEPLLANTMPPVLRTSQLEQSPSDGSISQQSTTTTTTVVPAGGGSSTTPSAVVPSPTVSPTNSRAIASWKHVGTAARIGMAVSGTTELFNSDHTKKRQKSLRGGSTIGLKDGGGGGVTSTTTSMGGDNHGNASIMDVGGVSLNIPHATYSQLDVDAITSRVSRKRASPLEYLLALLVHAEFRMRAIRDTFQSLMVSSSTSAAAMLNRGVAAPSPLLPELPQSAMSSLSEAPATSLVPAVTTTTSSSSQNAPINPQQHAPLPRGLPLGWALGDFPFGALQHHQSSSSIDTRMSTSPTTPPAAPAFWWAPETANLLVKNLKAKITIHNTDTYDVIVMAPTGDDPARMEAERAANEAKGLTNASSLPAVFGYQYQDNNNNNGTPTTSGSKSSGTTPAAQFALGMNRTLIYERPATSAALAATHGRRHCLTVGDVDNISDIGTSSTRKVREVLDCSLTRQQYAHRGGADDSVSQEVTSPLEPLSPTTSSAPLNDTVTSLKQPGEMNRSTSSSRHGGGGGNSSQANTPRNAPEVVHVFPTLTPPPVAVLPTRVAPVIAHIEGTILDLKEFTTLRNKITSTPINPLVRDNRGRCLSDAVDASIKPFEEITIYPTEDCTLTQFLALISSIHYASMTRDPDPAERVVDIAILENHAMSSILRRAFSVEPVDDPAVVDLQPFFYELLPTAPTTTSTLNIVDGGKHLATTTATDNHHRTGERAGSPSGGSRGSGGRATTNSPIRGKPFATNVDALDTQGPTPSSKTPYRKATNPQDAQQAIRDAAAARRAAAVAAGNLASKGSIAASPSSPKFTSNSSFSRKPTSGRGGDDSDDDYDDALSATSSQSSFMRGSGSFSEGKDGGGVGGGGAGPFGGGNTRLADIIPEPSSALPVLAGLASLEEPMPMNTDLMKGDFLNPTLLGGTTSPSTTRLRTRSSISQNPRGSSRQSGAVQSRQQSMSPSANASKRSFSTEKKGKNNSQSSAAEATSQQQQQQRVITKKRHVGSSTIYRIQPECKRELVRFLPAEKPFLLCPDAIVFDPDTTEFEGGYIEVEIKYGVREGDCVYLSLPPNKVAKPVTPPPLALPNTNNFGDISLNVDGGSMNPHSQSANSNNLNNSTLGDSTISPGGGGGGPNTSAITTRNRSRSLSSTNKSPASRVRGQSMGARQAPPPGLSIGSGNTINQPRGGGPSSMKNNKLVGGGGKGDAAMPSDMATSKSRPGTAAELILDTVPLTEIAPHLTTTNSSNTNTSTISDQNAVSSSSFLRVADGNFLVSGVRNWDPSAHAQEVMAAAKKARSTGWAAAAGAKAARTGPSRELSDADVGLSDKDTNENNHNNNTKDGGQQQRVTFEPGSSSLASPPAPSPKAAAGFTSHGFDTVQPDATSPSTLSLSPASKPSATNNADPTSTDAQLQRFIATHTSPIIVARETTAEDCAPEDSELQYSEMVITEGLAIAGCPGSVSRRDLAKARRLSVHVSAANNLPPTQSNFGGGGNIRSAKGSFANKPRGSRPTLYAYTKLRIEIKKCTVLSVQKLLQRLAFKPCGSHPGDPKCIGNRIIEVRAVLGDPTEVKHRRFDPYAPVCAITTVAVCEPLIQFSNQTMPYREGSGTQPFSGLNLVEEKSRFYRPFNRGFIHAQLIRGVTSDDRLFVRHQDPQQPEVAVGLTEIDSTSPVFSSNTGAVLAPPPITDGGGGAGHHHHPQQHYGQHHNSATTAAQTAISEQQQYLSNCPLPSMNLLGNIQRVAKKEGRVPVNAAMYKCSEIYNTEKNLVGMLSASPTEIFIGLRESDRKKRSLRSNAVSKAISARGVGGTTTSSKEKGGSAHDTSVGEEDDLMSDPTVVFPPANNNSQVPDQQQHSTAASIVGSKPPGLICSLPEGSTPISRRDIQNILGNLLVYENRSPNPQELRKLVLLTVSDEVSTTTALVEIIVQPVDDVTAIHRPSIGLLPFRNGFHGAYLPLFDGCYFSDPDTDYFNSGYVSVQGINGIQEGDTLRLMTLDEQRAYRRRKANLLLKGAAKFQEAMGLTPTSTSGASPSAKVSAAAGRKTAVISPALSGFDSLEASVRSTAGGGKKLLAPRPPPGSPSSGVASSQNKSSFDVNELSSMNQSGNAAAAAAIVDVPDHLKEYEFVYYSETKEVFLLVRHGEESPKEKALEASSMAAAGASSGDNSAGIGSGSGELPGGIVSDSASVGDDDFEQFYATSTFSELQAKAAMQEQQQQQSFAFSGDQGDMLINPAFAVSGVFEDTITQPLESLLRRETYYSHPEGRLYKVGTLIPNFVKHQKIMQHFNSLSANQQQQLLTGVAAASSTPGESHFSVIENIGAGAGGSEDVLSMLRRQVEMENNGGGGGAGVQPPIQSFPYNPMVSGIPFFIGGSHVSSLGGVSSGNTPNMASPRRTNNNNASSPQRNTPLKKKVAGGGGTSSSTTTTSGGIATQDDPSPLLASLCIKISPWLRPDDRTTEGHFDASGVPHSCLCSIHILSSLLRQIVFQTDAPPSRTKAGIRNFLVRVSPGGGAEEGMLKMPVSVSSSIASLGTHIRHGSSQSSSAANNNAPATITGVGTSFAHGGGGARASMATVSGIPQNMLDSIANPNAGEFLTMNIDPIKMSRPCLVSPFSRLNSNAGDVLLKKGFARVEIPDEYFNPVTDGFKLSELGKNFSIKGNHKLFASGGAFCGHIFPILHHYTVPTVQVLGAPHNNPDGNPNTNSTGGKRNSINNGSNKRPNSGSGNAGASSTRRSGNVNSNATQPGCKNQRGGGAGGTSSSSTTPSIYAPVNINLQLQAWSSTFQHMMAKQQAAPSTATDPTSAPLTANKATIAPLPVPTPPPKVGGGVDSTGAGILRTLSMTAATMTTDTGGNTINHAHKPVSLMGGHVPRPPVDSHKQNHHHHTKGDTTADTEHHFVSRGGGDGRGSAPATLSPEDDGNTLVVPTPTISRNVSVVTESAATPVVYVDVEVVEKPAVATRGYIIIFDHTCRMSTHHIQQLIKSTVYTLKVPGSAEETGAYHAALNQLQTIHTPPQQSPPSSPNPKGLGKMTLNLTRIKKAFDNAPATLTATPGVVHQWVTMSSRLVAPGSMSPEEQLNNLCLPSTSAFIRPIELTICDGGIAEISKIRTEIRIFPQSQLPSLSAGTTTALLNNSNNDPDTSTTASDSFIGLQLEPVFIATDRNLSGQLPPASELIVDDNTAAAASGGVDINSSSGGKAGDVQASSVDGGDKHADSSSAIMMPLHSPHAPPACFESPISNTAKPNYNNTNQAGGGTDHVNNDDNDDDFGGDYQRPQMDLLLHTTLSMLLAPPMKVLRPDVYAKEETQLREFVNKIQYIAPSAAAEGAGEPSTANDAVATHDDHNKPTLEIGESTEAKSDEENDDEENEESPNNNNSGGWTVCGLAYPHLGLLLQQLYQQEDDATRQMQDERKIQALLASQEYNALSDPARMAKQEKERIQRQIMQDRKKAFMVPTKKVVSGGAANDGGGTTTSGAVSPARSRPITPTTGRHGGGASHRSSLSNAGLLLNKEGGTITPATSPRRSKIIQVDSPETTSLQTSPAMKSTRSYSNASAASGGAVEASTSVKCAARGDAIILGALSTRFADSGISTSTATTTSATTDVNTTTMVSKLPVRVVQLLYGNSHSQRKLGSSGYCAPHVGGGGLLPMSLPSLPEATLDATATATAPDDVHLVSAASETIVTILSSISSPPPCLWLMAVNGTHYLPIISAAATSQAMMMNDDDLFRRESGGGTGISRTTSLASRHNFNATINLATQEDPLDLSETPSLLKRRTASGVVPATGSSRSLKRRQHDSFSSKSRQRASIVSASNLKTTPSILGDSAADDGVHIIDLTTSVKGSVVIQVVLDVVKPLSTPTPTPITSTTLTAEDEDERPGTATPLVPHPPSSAAAVTPTTSARAEEVAVVNDQHSVRVSILPLTKDERAQLLRRWWQAITFASHDDNDVDLPQQVLADVLGQEELTGRFSALDYDAASQKFGSGLFQEALQEAGGTTPSSRKMEKTLNEEERVLNAHHIRNSSIFEASRIISESAQLWSDDQQGEISRDLIGALLLINSTATISSTASTIDSSSTSAAPKSAATNKSSLKIDELPNVIGTWKLIYPPAVPANSSSNTTTTKSKSSTSSAPPAAAVPVPSKIVTLQLSADLLAWEASAVAELLIGRLALSVVPSTSSSSTIKEEVIDASSSSPLQLPRGDISVHIGLAFVPRNKDKLNIMMPSSLSSVIDSPTSAISERKQRSGYMNTASAGPPTFIHDLVLAPSVLSLQQVSHITSDHVAALSCQLSEDMITSLSGGKSSAVKSAATSAAASPSQSPSVVPVVPLSTSGGSIGGSISSQAGTQENFSAESSAAAAGRKSNKVLPNTISSASMITSIDPSAIIFTGFADHMSFRFRFTSIPTSNDNDDDTTDPQNNTTNDMNEMIAEANGDDSDNHRHYDEEEKEEGDDQQSHSQSKLQASLGSHPNRASTELESTMHPQPSPFPDDDGADRQESDEDQHSQGDQQLPAPHQPPQPSLESSSSASSSLSTEDDDDEESEDDNAVVEY